MIYIYDIYVCCLEMLLIVRPFGMEPGKTWKKTIQFRSWNRIGTNGRSVDDFEATA
jgi:hypothetical protein